MLHWLFPRTAERLSQGSQKDANSNDQLNRPPKSRSCGKQLLPARSKMTEPTNNNSVRKRIEDSFTQISGVIHASLRPLPTQTGDGSYLVDSSVQAGILKDLGHFNIRDVETLIDVVRNAANGEPVDDSTYLMERVIQASLSSSVLNDLSDHRIAGRRASHHLEERRWLDECISQSTLE